MTCCTLARRMPPLASGALRNTMLGLAMRGCVSALTPRGFTGRVFCSTARMRACALAWPGAPVRAARALAVRGRGNEAAADDEADGNKPLERTDDEEGPAAAEAGRL